MLRLCLGFFLGLSDQVGCFEHAGEGCDSFASFLDGLDRSGRVVELRLDGVLDIVEHLRKAEQVVLRFVEELIRVAQGDQVCSFPFHGHLDFVVQFVAKHFLLFDDFGGVLFQDVSRERRVIFEFDGCGVALLVYRATQSAGADLRIDGDGAVGCAVVVANNAFFDLAQFVVGVEVYIGFDVLERRVKGNGFASHCDAVGEALFSVERLCLVQVVGTMDEVVDSHEQVVCVVRFFEEAGRVLVQLRHEDFAVAVRNCRVRSASAPNGGAEEECIDELGFGASVKECNGLDHVGKRKPFADRDVNAVVDACFCDLADDGERVRREGDFADVLEPLLLFFGGDCDSGRDCDAAVVAVDLEQGAQGIWRDVVGQHDGERNLIAHFRTVQCGFWLLISRNNDGILFVVMDDNLKIVLALFIDWREVFENNQVEVIDVVGELLLLFSEL